MKKINKILLGLAVLLLLSSCAHSTNVEDCIGNDTSGFWSGLWHGIIAPISFFGSLVFNDIAVFAVDNNGGWYNFGFLLGVGGLFGGAGRNS
jgi:Phr family secreted Rap phosphatase inhibitor